MDAGINTNIKVLTEEKSMQEVIRAENMSYTYQSRYQKTQALSEVTCSFEKGVVYAITGKSGSGKSTFLSLLAGLDIPTEGTLYVDGKNIREINRDIYRKDQVAVIYQAFHLFPLLTVLENVMFPMKLQGISGKKAKNRAMELIEKVELPESICKKMPGMISGGEKQRAAIARTIASGAKIVLADEPSGNLDSHNEENIIELLCRLAHEENCTVIIVTHSDQIAMSADVVYGMSDGRLEVVRT